MKDTKLVILFVAIGLALAWFVGAPLRRPASAQPQVGTPLDEGKVYAEGIINVGPDVGNITSMHYPALFLFVKAPGGQGAPIAVKRIANPVFPFEYKLTQRNNMAGDDFYDGDIIVTARLDADGAVGPKQPGDLEAAAPIVKGADRHINLVLSR
jgi:hypothetical protein